MLGLLKGMSCEAYAVPACGEGADGHICLPTERVAPRLRDLLPMPSPQLGGNLGAADFQHGFSLPGAVVGATSMIGYEQSSEWHDTLAKDQRQRDCGQFHERT